MNIVTHKNDEFVNNFMADISQLDSIIKTTQMNNIRGLSNYLSMIEGVDQATNDLALAILKRLIENADQAFRYSPSRLDKYHVKSTHQRTIMTIFGALTFKKTFFVNKYTKAPYAYVDEFFGFQKYDRFDLNIKSLIVDACCKMSMSAAAMTTSSMIGNRTSKGIRDVNISRQCARTIVRKFDLVVPCPQRRDSTPDTLFVMLDEKYIPLQKELKDDAVVYHAVIFENIELVKGHKKRREVLNKHAFSSRSPQELNMKVLDYIYTSYDTKKINNIYVLGDGANWIKASANEYSMEGCNVQFALDRYHFLNAMRLIFLDKDLESVALDMILDNNKSDFQSICQKMLSNRPDRKDIITKKYSYIINNWEAIRLGYRKNLKCCMEGQISHNIAAVLAVRPGAYSLKSLDSLIKLRTAFKNGLDIKKMYLDSFSNKSTRQSKTNLDFSIFDMFTKKETYQLGYPASINFLSGGYA